MTKISLPNSVNEFDSNAHQQELVAKAKFSAQENYKLKFDLIALRRSQGLTLADMAERTGYSVKKITKFEKYYSDPKLSMLKLYALALEVSIAYTIVHDLPTQEDK